MGQLIVVRHAQSLANRDGVSLGRHDSPLTDLGRRQIAALADSFRHDAVQRILSSPLARAHEAARAIAAVHDLPVESDERLIEIDVGEIEGLPWAELRQRYPDFLQRWLSSDGATAMPGGESLADVWERAWPAVATVLEPGSDTAVVKPGSDAAVVVVTHNYVIRALICRALGLELRHWPVFESDLASRTTLEARPGSVVLRSFNDISHLLPNLVPRPPAAGSR